jgi:hypothetical protein
MLLPLVLLLSRMPQMLFSGRFHLIRVRFGGAASTASPGAGRTGASPAEAAIPAQAAPRIP